MATDLERLVVTLEARTKEYERALAKAQGTTISAMRKVERTMQASAQRQQSLWQRHATGIENTLKRLGPALGLTLGAAGLTRLARNARSAIADVAALADEASRAGASIEEMQALIFAVRQEGGDQSALVRSMGRLNEELGKAMEGSGDLERRLRDLNIPVRDLNGEARKTSDIFLDIADAVKGARSQQEAAVLVQRALGRGGREMLPFLKQGADTIRETMGLARETGAVISEELVLRAKAFDDAWTASADALGNKLKAAVVEVVVGMNDAGDATAGFAEVTKFLSGEIDGLVAGLNTTKREFRAVAEAAAFVLDVFDKITTLSPPEVPALSVEELRASIAQWERMLADAEKRGEFEAAANMRARIAELEQEIRRATASLIGPAFEQMGRQGAAAFEAGFKPKVSLPTVTRGVGDGGGSALVPGASGPVPVTVTRRVGLEPADVADGVERGSRSLTSAFERGITTYDEHGRAITSEARRTADGVREIPPGFDRLGERFASAIGQQTNALVTGLQRMEAASAAANAANTAGPHGGSAGGTQAARFSVNVAARRQLDALSRERDVIQSGLQFKQLSAQDERDAQLRLAQIDLETAKLNQHIGQVADAFQDLRPQLLRMFAAGVDFHTIVGQINSDLKYRLGARGGANFFSSSSIPQFAGGGEIHGPGGPKSDSVPIMASAGEFVVNAASAKKHRALLDAINGGRLSSMADGGLIGRINGAAQRFANGGAVKAAPAAPTGRGGVTIAPGAIQMTIMAQDVNSFRGSEREIDRQLASRLAYHLRDMGVGP